MNIKIIVFDLYNTLIEIKSKNHYFLKLYKLSKNGFNLDFMSYINLTMKYQTQELFNILPYDFEKLFNENIFLLNHELDSIETYNETISVLQNLSKKHEIYLISNLASPYKKPVYSFNLENYFSNMIFSCDHGLIKPDTNFFKIIETESGCYGKEILMVGGSEKSDIKGAQKMGWNYLKINRNKVQLENYVISNLTEIEQHLTHCV